MRVIHVCSMRFVHLRMLSRRSMLCRVYPSSLHLYVLFKSMDGMQQGVSGGWIQIDYKLNTSLISRRTMLSRYRLFPIALRSSTYWQQFTVSPASSKWLADNVSMNIPIDTIPSSYVWSMLETLEWPPQMTDLSTITIPAKSYSHPIHKQLILSHLRVISCLLKSIHTFAYKPVYFLFPITSSMYSNVTTST